MRNLFGANTQGEERVFDITENEAGSQEQQEPREIVQSEETVESQEPAPTNNTQEQGAETPTPEPSSLNTDEVTEAPVTQEPDPVVTPDPREISENDVFKFLSEKLDKPVNTLDDLITPQEVENPLSGNPEIQELLDWQSKTGRPLTDWVKFQKDYDSMSDLNVAREILQLEYPSLTESELNLELQSYTASEDDLDEDKARKSLELKKIATKGREKLKSLKLEFNTPLDNVGNVKLTPEQQQDLSLAQDYKKMLQDNEQYTQQYTSNIAQTVSNMKSLEMRLSDDVSLNYNLTDVDHKELPNFISSMSHWYNQDGSMNYEAVVKDAVKIKNHDRMLQLAFEQGLNSGKAQLLEQSNSTTISDSRATVEKNVTESKNEIQIEGGHFRNRNRGTMVRSRKKR